MLPVLISLTSRNAPPTARSSTSSDGDRRVRVFLLRGTILWFVTLPSCSELGPPPSVSADDEAADSFLSDP
jgi:hypothetical protein